MVNSKSAISLPSTVSFPLPFHSLYRFTTLYRFIPSTVLFPLLFHSLYCFIHSTVSFPLPFHRPLPFHSFYRFIPSTILFSLPFHHPLPFHSLYLFTALYHFIPSTVPFPYHFIPYIVSPPLILPNASTLMMFLFFKSEKSIFNKFLKSYPPPTPNLNSTTS